MASTIRHALISGASIAGPALAHQLAARGWRTTVLERAPRLRDEGHNIDVRGAAREVVRRMGVEDDVRAANTREIGMRFVDAAGRPVASFPMSGPGELDGPTAELEVLRGELARILFEHTAATTEYRFGTRITGVAEHDDRVTATLDDGTTIDADVLVVAEGLRSHTRELVLPGTHVRDLGMYLAYLTIPRRDTDDQWWNWFHAPGSRAVHLRPDNLGTTRAMLSFLSDVRGLEELDRADQLTVLRRTFADVGGPAPRVLAELDDAPLYFDALAQVRADRWSTGRTVLLGDSAFCSSPVGGGSASLALVGAYVLAGELGRTEDHRTAFARYEQFMRPPVHASQVVHRRVLEAANPRTTGGIRRLHAVARLGAGPVGRRVGGLLGARVEVAADRLELPAYPSEKVLSSR